MKKVYIQGAGSISSQKTFDNSEFLDEISVYNDTVISVVNPNYKEYIPPAAARRMAKGIKMGVVASRIAMQEANVEQVDAIITGTGMGCVVDSEKFVSAIIDNNEEFLTPTSFIQSTHNTVGGQIALGMGCKGYNFTYVHASNSFESALLDAKMQLELGEASSILVGGVDELGAHTIKIHRLIDHIKENAVTPATLLDSKSSGSVFSEGANFFVLGNALSERCYAEVVSVEMYNTLPLENLEETVEAFLKDNNLSTEEIDVVVMGNNGDVAYDNYYNHISSALFSETQHVYYKHLCGEFNTASSFGMWLGAKILKTQQIPEIVKLNETKASAIKHILLYNQYRGENHSLSLLKKC
ncbi:beta-ketoacyl synthase N-terminal-like domain-containing protein [Marinirhabdus gelatinilytica]|uniref:3-oxoacyl-(Acyl-carrier-protein) synthase n=1 Tax=Marinirhabdus gelatinilytica TaxID=1703343 RepID=A0A370QK56_9FLAO|nr:beta-ketoacyl synthase N-terminal-like domain-containing protein [Marinirhabdus gelatinilytica]RDK88744.1 3-oxoacyl-(acyl-carrier-protein) synthase [Marinirhabdus gelatinilytica]